jgi:hypothetical protein
MFENGLDTYDADLLFASQYQTLLGLEYWAWVKNQAFEKTFDYDGQLVEPCHIKSSLIGTPQILRYLPMDAVPSVEGTLDRLTSGVVKIEFGRPTGPFTVEVDPADNLKYKIYLEGSCVWEPDNASRTFDEVPSEPVYVLLSNVLHHPGSQVRYKVRVEPGPPGG